MICPILWVQVDGKLVGIPLQLLFNFRWPNGIHWHDLLQLLAINRPWLDWKRCEGLGQHVAPEPVASNRPLVLKVEDKLVASHVCLKRKVIDAFLCPGEMSDISHAFKDHRIGLEKPGIA